MASLLPTAGPIETRVKALVSEVFEPPDLTNITLTAQMLARSAAFLILAHAEIEHGIEQECLRTSGLLRTAADPPLAIMAWGIQSVKSDGKIAGPKAKTPLKDLADIYSTHVVGNNGVRTHNLKSLLLPLGIDMGAINTEVSALEEFGGRRGDLAHQPLMNWTTTDLPSVHVSSGVQAANSADQIVSVIQSSHSMIIPGGVAHRGAYVRRALKKALISIANRIEV